MAEVIPAERSWMEYVAEVEWEAWGPGQRGFAPSAVEPMEGELSEMRGRSLNNSETYSNRGY